MKKIFIILTLGFALMLTSCDQDTYFALERPNESPWQTPQEFENGVRTPYLYMTGAAWTNPLGMLPLRGFAESDISMYGGSGGASYHKQYWERQYNTFDLTLSYELEGAFQYLYDISTTTNAALQLIHDRRAEGKPVFDNMDEKETHDMLCYEGELLFMRAVAYWYLALTWGPMYKSEGGNDTRHFVLRKDYVSSAEALKNPTLGTTEEVFGSIVDDLKEAIAIFPDGKYLTTDNNQRMRVNKYAAEAMLARVLFYMARYDEAMTYLNDVIAQDNLYDLNDDPIEAWNKTSGGGYSKEVIWEICLTSDSDRYDRNPGIFQWAAYNGHVNKPSGYVSFAMSPMIMMQVGWMNQHYQVTDEARKDKRFVQLYRYDEECKKTTPGQIYIYKYYRSSAMPDVSGQRRANRPLIRLADLYIMRAQLYFMKGDLEKASDDLNMVRRRAGLDDLDAADINQITIDNERIKEMAGENADRIYWLRSLHRELPVGMRGVMPYDRDRQYAPIPYPYDNCYYRIPVLEQQTNIAYQE